MTRTEGPDLAELLPLVYRVRDAAAGGALEALLDVIAEQVGVLRDDLAQLYANWFVETCEDWVLPYIGELVSYRTLDQLSAPIDIDSDEGRRLVAALAPRREIANTVAHRRRKGTLAVLEELSCDIGGWNARAVEFYQHLCVEQSMRHVRLDRAATASVRDTDILERLDGAFDELPHRVDVRRINSASTRGRSNIPSVGVFAYRLRAYSVSDAPAFCIDEQRRRYRMSVLGNDAPLFTRPEPDPPASHLADELSVPEPLRRLAVERAVTTYYGPGRSFMIWRDADRKPVPANQIVIADLDDWRYRPARSDQVVVDPERGRIVFPTRNAPDGGVWVTYRYGFSDELGGGEYARPLEPVGERAHYIVGPGGDPSVSAALARWRADTLTDPAKRDAVIELHGSGDFTEAPEIDLEPDDRLELRAAQGSRSVIRLVNETPNQADRLIVRAKPIDEEEPGDLFDCPSVVASRPRLTIDGIVIAGRSVELTGALGSVEIRHCTLVPGWSLEDDCEPVNRGKPSLELYHTTACVRLRRSIVGSILVDQDELSTDPLDVRIEDSVVDATDSNTDAIGGIDGRYAHASLIFRRVTVRGVVRVHSVELGENTMFDGCVCVARRQAGCLRFCWVPVSSRTPRRYECQPDKARALERSRLIGSLAAGVDAALRREANRVRPRFTDVRYGTPGYMQLALSCAIEIVAGADDESEMGVFHDLFQPQRKADLETRLDEYVPAGCDAAVIFAT